MSSRQRVEEKLRESGFGPLDALTRMPGIKQTPVFILTVATDGSIAVTNLQACDTAIYFEGLHCQFEDMTLLIDMAVARAWDLIPNTSS